MADAFEPVQLQSSLPFVKGGSAVDVRYFQFFASLNKLIVAVAVAAAVTVAVEVKVAVEIESCMVRVGTIGSSDERRRNHSTGVRSRSKELGRYQ